MRLVAAALEQHRLGTETEDAMGGREGGCTYYITDRITILLLCIEQCIYSVTCGGSVEGI